MRGIPRPDLPFAFPTAWNPGRPWVARPGPARWLLLVVRGSWDTKDEAVTARMRP